MNGRGFLLDTNAIVQLLKGNADIVKVLSEVDFIATSIIAEMEFLSFSNLSENDAMLFRIFKSRIEVYDVPAEDPELTQLVIDARIRFSLKLPDAIIAGTAMRHGLTVLTADDHFKKENAPWKARFFAPC